MGQILSAFTYFARRLNEEMARARRGRGEFSLALFTIRPEPAELPDAACVRALPAILTGVRDTDCVARIGRDTIAVLLLDSSDEASRAAAIRLRDRLAADAHGGAAARWSVRILEYPEQESVLEDLSLTTAQPKKIQTCNPRAQNPAPTPPARPARRGTA